MSIFVAPPRGERGLKQIVRYLFPAQISRSPSWGAWIETTLLHRFVLPAFRRSPSWGAWIETSQYRTSAALVMVAPPRGERGLKHRIISPLVALAQCRSPSWGAWIEQFAERFIKDLIRSLPLVGSVD